MPARRGRAEALYAILTGSSGRAAREPGLEVLGDPELRDNPELVLAALRALISDDDPASFRALLPFAAHRWAGGWLAFETSPCVERGALLAEWLAATMPRTVATPLRWPTLTTPLSTPAEAVAIPDEVPGPEMALTMVARLWPSLATDDRARLHAIVVELFERAASVGAREQVARLRLGLGDTEHLAELRESAYPRLREFGIAATLAQDVEVVVVELGSLLVAGPQRSGDGERLASLERVLARAEQHALALDPRLGVLVYCQLDGGRWRLGRWHTETREWVDRTSFELVPELGPARRPRLRFAKSAKAGAFVVEYEDRTGERLRHHIRPDSGAWRHGPRASDLDRGTAKPEPKPQDPSNTPPKARAKPATPTGARSRVSKPARYEIREVGRGPSAHEGRLAVPGQRHLGVYDHQREQLVVTPPEAVAIALAGEHALVWASRRRVGQSGVARADHDWIVEVWALTGAGPLASHTVADRELIAWCWPDKITCAARTRHRIVRLSCRSEDDRTDLYLVRRDGEPWLETRDRREALAAR